MIPRLGEGSVLGLLSFLFLAVLAGFGVSRDVTAFCDRPWGYLIFGLFATSGLVCFVSRLYRGTIKKMWYPELPSLSSLSSTDRNLASARISPEPGACQTQPYGPIRTRRKRWGSVLGPAVVFLIGALFICGDLADNVNTARLKAAGQQTTGRLEMVKRTTHMPLFFLHEYSFEVSYSDNAGATHRSWLEANGTLYGQHTDGEGMFAHHEIGVVFLPDKPRMAGLPAALGVSVAGFLVGPLFILFGWGWWRHSRRTHSDHTNVLISGGGAADTKNPQI